MDQEIDMCGIQELGASKIAQRVKHCPAHTRICLWSTIRAHAFYKLHMAVCPGLQCQRSRERQLPGSALARQSSLLDEFQTKETPFKKVERWTGIVEKRHIPGQIPLSQSSSHERGPLFKKGGKNQGREKEADGSGPLFFIQAMM